ncbi:Fur family transcriptional regulator [Nocardiopsis coralliicola]
MAGPSGHRWQQELRDRGYRVTPQRRAVLDAVGALEHATPEAIHARVGEGLNLSTVYRTLDLLERLGLVTHTHLGAGAPSYHLAEEADHLHVVCRSCGGVADAPLDLAADMVRRLAAESGFSADARHLTVFGECGDCAAAAAS